MYPFLKTLYDSMKAQGEAKENAELAQTPVKKFTDQLSLGDKSSDPTGHAVLIVQDEEGQYLFLDNNLEGTPFFDPENPIVTDKLVGGNPTNNAFFDAYQSTTAELPLVGFVFDGNGTTVQSQEAMIEMINAYNVSDKPEQEIQPTEPEQPSLGIMDFN